MERLEAIEHLIEEGLEEAPRIVAERSREAVEALEAGIAAVMETARDQLRPEPRRPRAVRMLLIVLLVAAAIAVIGRVLPVLLQRGRSWQRQRGQEGRRSGPGVTPGRRATDVLDSGEGSAVDPPTTQPRVAIPVATPSTDGPPTGPVELETIASG